MARPGRTRPKEFGPFGIPRSFGARGAEWLRINRPSRSAAMMAPSKLSGKLLTELQRQLNEELGASHSYRALTFWCESQNLKGFARYFDKQAAEELRHANKIAAHLLDRSVVPEMAALPAPRSKFKSLLEVALHAQAMEQTNTQGIHQVYDAALGAKDYPAQVLMHWFIQEQVEEEQWTTEMVERVRAATSPAGLWALDHHIERYLSDRLFEDSGEGSGSST